MIIVKNFTLPDFQVKIFTTSISPNFNSFSHNNKKKMSENGWQKFFTATGSDESDKYQLCLGYSDT